MMNFAVIVTFCFCIFTASAADYCFKGEADFSNPAALLTGIKLHSINCTTEGEGDKCKMEVDIGASTAKFDCADEGGADCADAGASCCDTNNCNDLFFLSAAVVPDFKPPQDLGIECLSPDQEQNADFWCPSVFSCAVVKDKDDLYSTCGSPAYCAVPDQEDKKRRCCLPSQNGSFCNNLDLIDDDPVKECEECPADFQGSTQAVIAKCVLACNADCKAAGRVVAQVFHSCWGESCGSFNINNGTLGGLIKQCASLTACSEAQCEDSLLLPPDETTTVHDTGTMVTETATQPSETGVTSETSATGVPSETSATGVPSETSATGVPSETSATKTSDTKETGKTSETGETSETSESTPDEDSSKDDESSGVALLASFSSLIAAVVFLF